MNRLINTLVMKNPFISNKKRSWLMKDVIGSMGSDCEVFKNVDFGSEPYLIEIGDNVKITYGVRFITHDGGVHVLRNLRKLSKESIYGKIKVGNNVFIGNEAMILPGVDIGNNVIIGSRSVVTKSIPSNSVVAGCPAKIVSNLDKYYNKNKSKYIDTSEKKINDRKIYLLNMDSEKFIKK